MDEHFFEKLNRKLIVTGHYGSGKTEFSVSLAMLLASQIKEKIAIVDLDIVNPYFRSRERQDMLKEAGIEVYGSAYAGEITAEIPALGANAKTPLEDSHTRTIIDVGGNDAGAIVLNQYAKYFTDNTTVTTVINTNRPDTNAYEGVLSHIQSIEKTTNLKIDYIINNTHLLRETTAEMIIKSHNLCQKIGIPILCDCYPAGIVNPKDLSQLPSTLIPLGLYMRPTYLDK